MGTSFMLNILSVICRHKKKTKVLEPKKSLKDTT